MLDLFSGTGSVGDEFRRQGFEVISVDNNEEFQPTHLQDVLTWKYGETYAAGWFDVIFASPPCDHFTRARTIGTRDLELADQLVQKTLEILRFF